MSTISQGAVSIVGIGQTEFSKAAGRSETQLACESIVAALTDAGLTTDDVDGLVELHHRPCRGDGVGPSAGYPLGELLESRPLRRRGIPRVWSSMSAAAIASEAARVVVAYRSVKARSGERFGRASVGSRPTSSHSGSTAMQWCTPFGVVTPASWISLNATRYMHTFGVSSEDFGRAVVQLRDYASTNPNAHFFDRPITLDDHQSSKWIAEPSIRLFDCCQETDGSVALILTASRDTRASQLPVQVVSAAGSGMFGRRSPVITIARIWPSWMVRSRSRSDCSVVPASTEMRSTWR